MAADTTNQLAWSRVLAVVFGFLASLVVVAALFSGTQTKFEDAAILNGESYYASVDGHRIHCTGVADAHECIDAVRANPGDDVVLWLGNSQLHAINQFKQGDVNATPLLHEQIRPRHQYLVTFSEPNASLQEHLVLFSYLLPRLKPRVLLLPVVFDDFREAGLRTDLLAALDDPGAMAALGRSPIGQRLLHEKRSGTDAGDDLAGIHATLQERSERFLNRWLQGHWKTWADRPEARGQIFIFLYDLRNTLLGIRATSARKMIPGRFADNWQSLEAIMAMAAEAGVRVYLYIPPIRNDVPIPYDEKEYAAFKARVQDEFGSREGVAVGNLERVVPNQYWGTKESTNLKGKPEYDFMHFQAPGHKLFADAMFGLVTGAGDTGGQNR